MSAERGDDGFRLLPEFVCRAIPAPGVISEGAPTGVGGNAGFVMLDEFVCKAIDPGSDTVGDSEAGG